MAEIILSFTDDGVPLTSPAAAPEITIRRTDTQVIVAGPIAMTELGEGQYVYTFAPASTLEYGIVGDGDPSVTGQVTPAERYVYAGISGITVERIETDIPAILVDTGTTIPGLLSGLEDLSIADVQTALTNQGYTTVRAALLDNMDDTISSRATVASILAAALTSGDTINEALSRLDNIDTSVTTTIPGLITLLNDLSIADVQTALTNQGYTTTRAVFLDNLDATISSVATAIAALNDVSIADVQTAMTNQGYTTVRAALLDDLAIILTSVEKIRKVTSNKVVVNVGDTQVDVYEDDDSSVAFSFTISSDRRDRTPI